MMSKIINSKIVYVLWLMIQGAASFLISGLIACIAILHLDNYILGTIIAGGDRGTSTRPFPLEAQDDWTNDHCRSYCCANRSFGKLYFSRRVGRRVWIAISFGCCLL